MKKIIGGKVYDTEKAECVGEFSSGCYTNDFDYCSEELYRKRTGEFFLHGEGGPISKYAVSVGNNSWSGGRKIIPLTYEAARKWAEEHLSGEKYEEIFGEVVENDTRVIMAISVSTSTAELAKRIAAKNGISVSALIENLIAQNT